MTDAELRALFPQGSGDFLAANSAPADFPAGTAGAAAELEPSAGAGSLGALAVQTGPGPRFLVRVESVRKRLLDEDNACEKYHVDLLRTIAVIPEDNPATAKIEVTQRQPAKGEAERIIIEVYERMDA